MRAIAAKPAELQASCLVTGTEVQFGNAQGTGSEVDAALSPRTHTEDIDIDIIQKRMALMLGPEIAVLNTSPWCVWDLACGWRNQPRASAAAIRDVSLQRSIFDVPNRRDPEVCQA